MKKRSSQSKHHIFGLLFWIGALSLVLIVFFLNREEINRVLESTGFTSALQSRINDPVEVVISSSSEAPADEITEEEPQVLEVQEAPNEVPEVTPREETEAEPEKNAVLEEISKEEPSKEVEEISLEENPPRIRQAKLYYIRLLDEGKVVVEGVERSITYSTSPLTDTINVLLQGPTSEEIAQGFLNLIPHETKLHKVWIENRIAYLDFNEAFLFNTAGTEGTIAQIQQIVFSTLQFSTISSVQILIEGEKVEYLSGEGIYIGKPLSRNTPLIQETES